MGKYFSTFPYTTYANTNCKDIIRSNGITPASLKSSAVYYDFDIQSGQRPDTVSYDYYKNSYYDWMVYKANSVVDPYTDWYLAQETLDELIKSKYGTIAAAIEKILYYEVNWVGDDRRLSASTYNAMGVSEKRYWRPATDDAFHYVRKELDWKVATNLIVKVFVADAAIFTRGDHVIQSQSGTVIASGEVSFVGPDHILVQTVEGGFATSSTISIPSSDLSTTTTTQAPVVVTYSIPLTEFVYWRAVNAYDYEVQLNEEKRRIKLIGKDYIQTVQREHEVKILNG